MFSTSKEELKKLGADITTAEIMQQPALWLEAFSNYKTNKTKIDAFLNNLVSKYNRVRVIFTGAGTSAYVGNTVLPYLKTKVNEAAFDMQSVATTSIVSNPYHYFKADIPTLLVSFARSGNSPESVATVNLGRQIVKDFYQITITCAPEGKLAQNAKGDDKNLLLLMPPKSNDQGFAMTGSYSCMVLTALLAFDNIGVNEAEKIVNTISALGKTVTEREAEIQKFIDLDFSRIIYLGSGSLEGLANESQLKILELTAGRVASAFNSSLGFRHGPKSFVNDKSLIFVFVSNNAYSRLYDVDMLNEMQADKIAKLVCAVTAPGDINYGGPSFTFAKEAAAVPDAYLALPYVMFGQAVSLLASVKVANKPDTPSPTGTVNRVVKGVIIHDYKEAR